MRIKVLHIAAYYSGSNVYSSMVSELWRKGLSQRVYAPVRYEGEVGRNNVEDVDINYDQILTKSDRLMFRKKIRKLSKRVAFLYDLSKVDVVHAHTLFSDGAVAYEIFKKFNTPYIIAVRNTDLNVFLKYMPHLRPLANSILQSASKVIFLNNEYKESFVRKMTLKQDFFNKLHVIPNGIDTFWHENKQEFKNIKTEKLNFLYVGDYSPNKNIPYLLAVLKHYASRSGQGDISVQLVGGGKARGKSGIDTGIAETIRKGFPKNMKVTELGKVKSLVKLQELYQKADFFCMLSKNETFGLVYAEAMSQGTPIIYTKGQGIGPYFKDFEVGFSVDLVCDRKEDVSEKLDRLVENYSLISKNASKASQRFDWRKITTEYLSAYEEITLKSKMS